jgi:large subunit ribosomal protein L29
MKKKELETLKNLSLEELRSKETELRQELFTQRLYRATKPAKDNQSAQKLRRNIARVLTVIQQKHAST